MTECPVCGHSEAPLERRPTDAELAKNRILAIFSKNLQQSWWTCQPVDVCKWLANMGVSPATIIDVGCGDARWLPGIISCWPNVKYTGIDIIKEHQDLNQENCPEYTWILGNFNDMETKYYDMVLVGGTLNPKMLPEERQRRFHKKILAINPIWIVCLFDLNSSGLQPHEDLDGYKLDGSYMVPNNLQHSNQKDIVWLFKRKGLG